MNESDILHNTIYTFITDILDKNGIYYRSPWHLMLSWGQYHFDVKYLNLRLHSGRDFTDSTYFNICDPELLSKIEKCILGTISNTVA